MAAHNAPVNMFADVRHSTSCRRYPRRFACAYRKFRPARTWQSNQARNASMRQSQAAGIGGIFPIRSLYRHLRPAFFRQALASLSRAVNFMIGMSMRVADFRPGAYWNRVRLIGRGGRMALIGFRSAVGRRIRNNVVAAWRSSQMTEPIGPFAVSVGRGRRGPDGNPQASPGPPEWPDARGLKPVRSRRGFASRDAVRRPRKGAAR